MGRPENPIIWDGPVAEQARALRDLRERAGLPSYRTMAAGALCGPSVLAAAAAGHHCPTWAVLSDFVRACNEDPKTWRPLWERAQAASRKRQPARGKPGPVRATSSAQTLRPAKAPRPSPPSEPDPWQASTPGEYVMQLRALRAWKDQTNIQDNRRAAGRRLASSTVYDALNPNRNRMPPLEVVRAIVAACQADVEQWVRAWQSLRMKEYTSAPVPRRPASPLRIRAERESPPPRVVVAQPRYEKQDDTFVARKPGRHRKVPAPGLPDGQDTRRDVVEGSPGGASLDGTAHDAIAVDASRNAHRPAPAFDSTQPRLRAV